MILRTTRGIDQGSEGWTYMDPDVKSRAVFWPNMVAAPQLHPGNRQLSPKNHPRSSLALLPTLFLISASVHFCIPLRSISGCPSRSTSGCPSRSTSWCPSRSTSWCFLFVAYHHPWHAPPAVVHTPTVVHTTSRGLHHPWHTLLWHTLLWHTLLWHTLSIL